MTKGKILITGAAGFIGFHLSQRLCKEKKEVIGLDNLNDYYDVELKKARLRILEQYDNFEFVKMDLKNTAEVLKLFEKEKFEYVVNLAAQAGVRYSIQNPFAYVDSNIHGFINVLEGCRNYHIKHLVYASSSSVYGANKRIPFTVHDNVDHPMSLYAASKKSNELMAHTYSSLYNLPTTGLRFFTVYGPWGRPDMAAFLFTRAILNDKPIDVFNNGDMMRDFTYVGDIVEGVYRVMQKIPESNKEWKGETPDSATSYAPFRLYNIGNNKPVQLMEFIGIIEKHLGKMAKKNFLPLQPGDVPSTYADVDDLIKDVGFKPNTGIEEGLQEFIMWYKKYYQIQ